MLLTGSAAAAVTEPLRIRDDSEEQDEDEDENGMGMGEWDGVRANQTVEASWPTAAIYPRLGSSSADVFDIGNQSPGFRLSASTRKCLSM